MALSDRRGQEERARRRCVFLPFPALSRSSPSSLEAVQFWAEELQQRLASCVIVVAANKADLLSNAVDAAAPESNDEESSANALLTDSQRQEARAAMEVLSFSLLSPSRLPCCVERRKEKKERGRARPAPCLSGSAAILRREKLRLRRVFRKGELNFDAKIKSAAAASLAEMKS